MRDWRRVSLNTIAEIYDGPHATPTKLGHGPWYLNIASLQSGRLRLEESVHITEDSFALWTRRVRPCPGDVLFSYETRLGEAAAMPDHITACLGRRMGLLRPRRSEVEPRFLLYAYLGPLFQETIRQRTVHGATVERLPISEMGTWEIEVPPLSEQLAIAEVLGALDDKIGANRRTIGLLDNYARAVFESWFDVTQRVDGVPVDELVELNPSRSLRAGTPAAYVGMSSLPTTSAVISNWERKPAGSGQRFTNGDTLMARITPCLENGKTAFVNILSDDEVGWGSTEYVVIRPRRPLPLEWGYCLARSDAFRAFAIQNMSGTSGRQRFSASSLHHYRIEPPASDTSARFGEIAGPIFRMMGALQTESRRLSLLRDVLLPGLLSGELKVRPAEDLIEDVV